MIEDRRQARCRSLSGDIQVPSEIFDSNSAGTEEMMRIKSLGHSMRVPVPRSRGYQRDRREERKL